MDKKQFALDKHREWAGKIEVVTRAPITNREEQIGRASCRERV